MVLRIASAGRARHRRVAAGSILFAVLVGGNGQGSTPQLPWGPPDVLDDARGEFAAPQVAADARGDVFAVWVRPVGFTGDLWESHHAPGKPWSEAVTVAQDVVKGFTDPAIVVAADGSALALFVRVVPGTGQTVISSIRYDSAKNAWQPEDAIHASSLYSIGNPELALDGRGDAVAVWQQGRSPIWGVSASVGASRYVAGRGWGTNLTFIDPEGYDEYNPRVGVDAAGNAIVVWTQSDSGGVDVWWVGYDSATGWGSPGPLDRLGGNATFPALAVSAGGTAFALWANRNGTDEAKMVGARYTPEARWEEPFAIGRELAGEAVEPAVAADERGDAVAVWIQNAGYQSRRLWGNSYSTETGWSGPAAAGSGPPHMHFSPSIAADPGGGATYVWWDALASNETGSSSACSGRFYRGGPFAYEMCLDADNEGDARLPDITLDGEGRRTAVWAEDDGRGFLVYARSDPPLERPASPDPTPLIVAGVAGVAVAVIAPAAIFMGRWPKRNS